MPLRLPPPAIASLLDRPPGGGGDGGSGSGET
jgi:hypothetical protein